MSLLPVLLFAVSSNMDNLVVGLSYGIKKIRIAFTSNLVIALITLTGTLVSMLIGKSLLRIIPVSAAGWLGSAAIIAIGCFYLVKFIRDKREKKEDKEYIEYDKDRSGSIELREAFALGFMLTLNNLGLGVSAGVTGLSILTAPAASFICSLLFIRLGNWLGKSCLAKAFGRFAEPAASLLMIVWGMYQLIG